jgi:hypothetical protein
MDKNKILLVISFFAIILESIVSIALLSRFQVKLLKFNKKRNFVELSTIEYRLEIRILRSTSPLPNLLPNSGRTIGNGRTDNSVGAVRDAGDGEPHQEVQKRIHHLPDTHAHHKVALSLRRFIISVIFLHNPGENLVSSLKSFRAEVGRRENEYSNDIKVIIVFILVVDLCLGLVVLE